MKPRPFKSRLIPFTAQIKAWRRAGDTWQEVVDKLAALHCKTDASAVCRFIGRVNRRPSYPRGAEPEPQQPAPPLPPPASSEGVEKTPSTHCTSRQAFTQTRPTKVTIESYKNNVMTDSTMPNGSNRLPLSRVPDADPPELRVLLLSIPDQEARNLARSWFYQTMQGDASIPCVQLRGIISILVYAAAQPKQFSASPNGQGKYPELETLARSIKALPGRDDVAARQDLKALQHEVSKVAEAVQKSDQARAEQVPDLRAVTEDLKFAAKAINQNLSAAGRMPETPLMKWAKRVGIAAVAALIAFAAGYLICSNNLRSDMDARVDRVINAQPAAASVPLFLASRAGAEKIGPIKGPNGESQGIIIAPGKLKLGKPFISTTGEAVVPIP